MTGIMTHFEELPDMAGVFSRGHDTDRDCPCGAPDVIEERWDSTDGAYTDWRYTCRNCKREYWIEGPDA